MNKALSFSDVLIVPGFSEINSRKDVDLSVHFMGQKLNLPVISAPMDTVTSTDLAIQLHNSGGLASLHRFQHIQDNINQFKLITTNTNISPIVSIGLNDWERVDALYAAGADKFIIDVAHGAQQQVVDFTNELCKKYGPSIHLMVGNFATSAQVSTFLERTDSKFHHQLYWRTGVGGGSACTTRIKTGCGIPTLTSVVDMTEFPNVIADGGIKTPGDIAKCLAAGAQVAMLGGMLGGTFESPGDIITQDNKTYKRFRGSASASSYKDQNKNWSTPEGEEFLVPYKGSVKNILLDIEGGLRSALTYVGALNLTEFKQNAQFVEITASGWKESQPHGKE